MRILFAGCLFGALALAGCNNRTVTREAPANSVETIASEGEAGTANASAQATAQPVLNLAPDGLARFEASAGTSKEIAFGTPKAAAREAVEKVTGLTATEASNSDCPAGPVVNLNFPDGLTLLFQEDSFAGWSVTGNQAPTTASGVGLGSTRKALDAAYDAQVASSTLGLEFSAEGLSGILDGPTPNARIRELWAGVSCVAR